MSNRPKWLIAGGMGMIGRNLVKYLIDNNLASDIRIADKRVAFMAFLNPDHKAAIEDPIVEVVQADISDEDHLERVLAEPRTGGAFFDYVVNLAAETAHGKSEEFYQKMVDGAARLGAACARLGAGTLKKFVHVSTAQVYKSDKGKAAREDAKAAPWTLQAEYMLRSEAALHALGGSFPLVILRPAIVYGPGDVAGLMPRAVIAASYVKMKAKMELLWDGDMKMNTVHVFDVVRAIYFVARKAEPGSVYNLADKGDTDQGKITSSLGRVFSIEWGFYGSMMSNIAKLKLDSVVDEANQTHLAPWLGLLKEHGIRNTPLSPYLHKQLLQHNHLYIDGSAIELTGFKYAVPELTDDGIREVVAQHITQGIFPPIL